MIGAVTLVHHGVLAAAGGGSGGFGGGGGGGGGGFGGGFAGGGGGSGSGPGGSTGIGPLDSRGVAVVVGVLFVLVVGVCLLFPALRRRAGRAARTGAPGSGVWRRRARVEAVAEEAAAEDPAFAPETLLPRAVELAHATQEAWDAGDRAALAGLVGPDLLAEWRLRLDDFDARGWRARSRIVGEPAISLVRVVNRREDRDDRVVVHVAADARSWVDTPDGRIFEHGRTDARVPLSEYWTLGRRDGTWILLTVEQELEGAHHLHAPNVATPADDPDLAEEARAELAADDAVPGVRTVVPVALDDAARAAADDLALLDDRFSPAVLAGAVRSTVAAWAGAVDGPRDALASRATTEAVTTLLGEDDAEVRTVVRGVDVREVAITGVDGDHDPPRIAVVVLWRGIRYREVRATQVRVDGSASTPAVHALRWTMELADGDPVVWRLVAA